MTKSVTSLTNLMVPAGTVRSVAGRYAPLWPVINWGLFALGLLMLVGVFSGAITYGDGRVMQDGRNYWEGLAYSDVHYRYSPAFLWLTAPLRALPFEVFTVVWTGLHIGAVAWLAPWMLAVPGVTDDIIAGNVNTFLAVAVVLTVRPSVRSGLAAAWASVLLTKVTPGVGVLVHIGRREWSRLAVGLGATAAIVLVGFLIDPFLWAAWFDSLSAGTENYLTIDVLAPLPVRVAIGAGLCLLAARWIWLLPLGMIVAMPGLWPSSFALLAALPRFLRSSTDTA